MSILLAWNNYLVGGLTVLFLVVCVMMILTVLIQRPQGGGLSGAFGSGAGSGQTAFGAKTGDALTIFTIIVFVMFIGFGIVLNFGYRPDTGPAAAGAAPAAPTDGDPATPGRPPASTAQPQTPPPGQVAPANVPPAEPAPTAPPTPAPQPPTDPAATPATAPK